MKHKKFRQEINRRWVQPVMKNYYMACCDCNLVHRMDFRVVTNKKTGQQKVQFRASRAPKYTSRLRKNMRKSNKKERN